MLLCSRVCRGQWAWTAGSVVESSDSAPPRHKELFIPWEVNGTLRISKEPQEAVVEKYRLGDKREMALYRAPGPVTVMFLE